LTSWVAISVLKDILHHGISKYVSSGLAKMTENSSSRNRYSRNRSRMSYPIACAQEIKYKNMNWRDTSRLRTSPIGNTIAWKKVSLSFCHLLSSGKLSPTTVRRTFSPVQAEKYAHCITCKQAVGQQIFAGSGIQWFWLLPPVLMIWLFKCEVWYTEYGLLLW